MQRYFRIRDPDGRQLWVERRDGRYRGVDVPECFGDLAAKVVDATAAGEDVGAIGEVELLPPTDPTKIVCVGRNYRRHAEELDNPVPEEPLVFLKPPSALIADGESILLPSASEEVHHEAELALVMGDRVREVRPSEAESYVAGYTCANDVTARDIQSRESAFSRAKGYDTFCPAGPGLVPSEAFEPSEHGITCRVGEATRQSATFDDLIFSVSDILTFVTDIMTLEAGDLVLTGTPSGVGPLESGDIVEVSVDGVGTLSNPVRER